MGMGECTRIAVVSDSHGDVDTLKQFILQNGPFDVALHAGDGLADLYEALANLGSSYSAPEMMPYSYLGVTGNCDAKDNLQKLIIDLESIRILTVHGHLETVNSSLIKLKYTAYEEGAGIVVFGHTHIPVSVEQQGILFFNPGSISRPRGDAQPSAGILELKAGEIVESKILNING